MRLKILRWIINLLAKKEVAGKPATIFPQHQTSFDSDVILPKTDRQIIIDSSEITTMLMEAGYEPMQALMLLAKIYGVTVGTMPENMRDQNGRPITQQDIETNFFFGCRTERKIYAESTQSTKFELKRMH